MTAPLCIDYVSPLPPTRSGIADYSRDLLPLLEPLCDLRVIRLADLRTSDELEQTLNLVPEVRLGEDGRLPLYQMGNNRHHRAVWRVAHTVPGVLTLHDVALHHLLIELTLAEGKAGAYLDRLETDHGWWGKAAAGARKYLDSGNSALFGLPVHRSLLRHQRGVLVHSQWAADIVHEFDSDLPVRVVPMGIPLPAPVEPRTANEWRQSIGVAPNTRLLGSFGFQTPIKRSHRVIAALADERLADAHLIVGGEVSPGLDLEGVAREAGVADRIHCLGFLDYRDFEIAIAACDLCVNLRYPTAGETSASLLRELATGRPVVVSDYAQFSELPDEVALKIPLGEGESEALAHVVGSLFERPARLEEMSRAARHHIEAVHSPEKAARAVVDACAELGELEPLVDAPFEAPRPSSLVWRRLPGRLSVAGADLPWRGGETRRLRLTLTNDGFARWLSARHDPGGVMVELQWRDHRAAKLMQRRWLDLPRALSPGESIEFDVTIRRPLEAARLLIVEPHVKQVGGFNTVGGPTWALRLE